MQVHCKTFGLVLKPAFRIFIFKEEIGSRFETKVMINDQIQITVIIEIRRKSTESESFVVKAIIFITVDVLFAMLID